VVGGDGVGDGLQQHGLAGAGRSDDEAALAFADGREQVHDAAADALAHGLHLDALLRIERRQVVEEDLVARLLGRLEVDGLDLDQREVLLAFVRRADVAADGVAGLEIELANLRGRDVDVVGAGQIVVIGRAEEAVAVGEDLEDAFGEDVAFFFALRLEDLEDQILFAKAAGAGNLQGARNAAQFSDVLFFQFCDGHVHLQGGMFVRGFGRGKCSRKKLAEVQGYSRRGRLGSIIRTREEYRNAGEAQPSRWKAALNSFSYSTIRAEKAPSGGTAPFNRLGRGALNGPTVPGLAV
jgi:hypothetical protein